MTTEVFGAMFVIGSSFGGFKKKKESCNSPLTNCLCFGILEAGSSVELASPTGVEAESLHLIP